MAFAIELTRPDDLLSLRVEGRNLHVDRNGEDGPALTVEDPQQPAFLLVDFPPQAIAERAYFEATIVAGTETTEQTVTGDIPDGGRPEETSVPIEPLDAPGAVPAAMSRGSRLVFEVAPGARIPLTVAGLLDWSSLRLHVNAIAAIGLNPTPEQIASAPAIAKPSDVETALELPYRLVVSPTADVEWTHRATPFTSRGRTELWHTRLAHKREDAATGEATVVPLTATDPASFRAIWSDDFNTATGRDPKSADPLGRTAMSPNDRHQIVVKTSAFHGYQGEVTLHLGGLATPSAFSGVDITLQSAAIQASSRAAATHLSPVGGAGIDLKYWAPYVPLPFRADEVMLSALGGWLHSQGSWPLVQKAPRRRAFEALDLADVVSVIRRAAPRPGLRGDGRAQANASSPVSDLLHLSVDMIPGLEARQPAGDQSVLDLSEWVHVATQGRDHYVRIVYEGELLPFGHPAALVKVTERKFKQDKSGLIVARLFQRNFIVVRKPEMVFSHRGLPFTKVRLTTLVTPDLAPAEGAKLLGDRSFWVEVMTTPTTSARFAFHAVATDHAGKAIDLALPMIFLSQADQGDKRQGVRDAYNDSKTLQAMLDRQAFVPAQKIQFAVGGTDNSNQDTRSLTFVVAGDTPRLLKADIVIPQVQELLGTDTPTSIGFYKDYVDRGLAAVNGAFAEVVQASPTASHDPFAAVAAATLPIRFTSDKAGGFATPNMDVSTLSSALGPLGAKASQAVADTFDPASFFPSSTGALLFGAFDLAKILLGGALTNRAPRITTERKTEAGEPILEVRLDWTPQVTPFASPIAALTLNGSPDLTVTGLIRKPLSLDGVGKPQTDTRFKGELHDFTITLLKVVDVKFQDFVFESRSGSKPSVTVRLDPNDPLTFRGDLKFVQELKDALPPGLFGDGASLDLLPTGIRASFSFALPPIEVGVFALKDVSLGAALTLPFLDGRPSLDFNVSERPHPFLLSVGIFGGGGFFHLQLNTAGLKIVEAALEFGVVASVDLGVASGGVHIMAGIYFKLERKDPGGDLAPTLTGYLRMGGHLSVLGLIKLSLEFTLSFTYDGTRDKAYGRATLTVDVEVAFFSVSVDITVEKAFGGSGDDPDFRTLFPATETWDEYAVAFA